MLLIQALFLSVFAFGQVSNLVEDKAPDPLQTKDGFTPSLKVSFSFSQQSSDSVIGQQSGDTIALGTAIEGGLIWKNGQNEVRNNLKAQAATSRSPVTSRYTKSADELKYSYLQLRSLQSYPNWGPYGKLELNTTMFKGEDFQTGEVKHLTDAFRPLTTKESVGVFGKLLKTKHRKFEMRFGIGAQQVKADGQSKVDSYDADTNVLSTSELKSYSQSGVELGAEYEQKFDEKSTLKFVGELFQPINPDLEGPKDERSGTDLLDSLFSISVTTKSYEWLSMSIEAKYQRQPQLQDREQRQISILANISFSFFEKPPESAK